MENERKLLEYIDHAIKNLTAASKELKYFGVNNTDRDLNLIKGAVINDKWEIYLNHSNLITEEIIAVKNWFDYINNELISYINQLATNNTPVELQNAINNLVNARNILAVRKKLSDAVNQERS